MKRPEVKKESINHAFEQMLMPDMQLGIDIGCSFKFHFNFKNKYFLTSFNSKNKKYLSISILE